MRGHPFWERSFLDMPCDDLYVWAPTWDPFGRKPTSSSFLGTQNGHLRGSNRQQRWPLPEFTAFGMH